MEDILGVRVQIHPVALFSVVDSYERRQESDKRVIGSLLGVKTQPGLVEVRSGYAVPHNETADEVGVVVGVAIMCRCVPCLGGCGYGL